MATASKRPKVTVEILTDLTMDETLFDHLPDEVQLKIFKFLETKDLIRCAQVSKRTRRKRGGFPELLILGSKSF